MRAIPFGSSLLTFWENLVFLEAALLATDETRPLAVPVTALLDEFKGTLEYDLESRRSVIQANARVSVRDAALDEGVRGLHSAALHLVKQDRKASLFTTLFSEHIGETVRHALERQVKIAEDLVRKLALTIFPQAFRMEHIPVLTSLIAAGKAALDGRKEAETARVGTRLSIRDWKTEANAVRLAVYGDLMKLAADAHRTRGFADAFFPREGRAGVEGGDEPVEEQGAPSGNEPPAPGGTPG